MIPFEGENYPLQEIVTVGRKSPQMMVVNLAALPQVIPSVLKAIRECGMGLNPQQDGTTIYIAVPK
jgi:ribosome recycling factor